MEEVSIQLLDQSPNPDMDDVAVQSLFAQTSYRLREARKAVLRRHGVDDEAALLARIAQGEVAPHPAYEDYLSALIIGQNQAQIRAELSAHMAGAPEPDPISVHLLLRDGLERHYAARLAEPVRLAQDALLLSFDTGLMLEVRYFSRQEYSIMWCWGEAERRIDTAPQAGHVTCSGIDCWQHFSGLLDLLLEDPLRAASWSSSI